MNETFGEVETVGGGAGTGPGKHLEDDDNLVLWVGNLDSKTTENMLYELFCQAGPILHIRLPKNPDGQGHKGYSFVTFQHEASVPYAINVMEGTTLFGKKLKLQPRPGSIHRKIMDQKKAAEQRQDIGFQGQIPGQGVPGPVPVPPPGQQWFAQMPPQMAAQVPNMFLYPNQLYQTFSPPNVNMMAIPFQPSPGQMGASFVQLPIQQGPPPGTMIAQQPQQQPPLRSPRTPNGYNNYSGQGGPQGIRATSPGQQQPQGGNPSHYMNGQGGPPQYHQPRGHYQNHRGSRPPRSGGYSNGSLNNNPRMQYQHQQRMPAANVPQQQQYMINSFPGQSPEYRRGNPPQQQQPSFGTHGGQNYGNPPNPANGFANVVYHY